MKRPTCPRCGLEVAGQPHMTAGDCLRHLAPRYRLAQASVEHMHKRYRRLETQLERAKMHERAARQEAKKNATIPARLAALEAAMNGFAHPLAHQAAST